MSTWTAPVTWANGAVTAATMNTEVRDHLNFLKGSLDVISAGTTADTGTTMYIRITRASGDPALTAAVSGDTQTRLAITADGALQWGSGTAIADTILWRLSPAALATDSQFYAGNVKGINLSGGGYIEFIEGGLPAAAPVNSGRLYLIDNGAGKSSLRVIFNTGAAQTLATEP